MSEFSREVVTTMKGTWLQMGCCRARRRSSNTNRGRSGSSGIEWASMNSSASSPSRQTRTGLTKVFSSKVWSMKSRSMALSSTTMMDRAKGPARRPSSSSTLLSNVSVSRRVWIRSDSGPASVAAGGGSLKAAATASRVSFDVEGRGEKILDAASRRQRPGLGLIVGRHREDHGREGGGGDVAHLANEFEAIHSRQEDVGDNEVEVLGAGLGQGFDAVFGFDHTGGCRGQELPSARSGWADSLPRRGCSP